MSCLAPVEPDGVLIGFCQRRRPLALRYERLGRQARPLAAGHVGVARVRGPACARGASTPTDANFRSFSTTRTLTTVNARNMVNPGTEYGHKVEVGKIAERFEKVLFTSRITAQVARQ